MKLIPLIKKLISMSSYRANPTQPLRVAAASSAKGRPTRGLSAQDGLLSCVPAELVQGELSETVPTDLGRPLPP